jgi:hypothetical protein
MDNLSELMARGIISELKVRTEPYERAQGQQSLALIIRFGVKTDEATPDEVWATACRTLLSTASGVAGVDRAVLEIELTPEIRH